MKSGRKHHVNKMVSPIGRFYEEINTFRLSVTPIVTADARMLAISFLSIENVTRACGDRARVYLSSVTRCEMKISYRDSEYGIIRTEMGYLFVQRGKGQNRQWRQ